MTRSHRPDTLFQDQIARSICRTLVEEGAVAGPALDVHLGVFGGWRVVLDDELSTDRPSGLGLALGDTVNLVVDLLTATADGEPRTDNPAADKLESLGFDGRRDSERHRLSAQVEPIRLLVYLARRRLGDEAVDRLIAEASNRYLDAL
ncbi:MAG: hypothetical protein AAGE94_02555 [Acidobacteriota bacterium]